MTFKLVKDYIDQKLNESHSDGYYMALRDLSKHLLRLETQNACHFCGELDVKYPHNCNGFTATSPHQRTWTDDQAGAPFSKCYTS
jgi:hypothetical protein